MNLKIAQLDDDTSCSALNRLRAKLRELMKGGQKADNQVSMVVEKSIETMVELSKGCEDLKSENETLLAQLEKLRKQLAEKDKMISDLENKLFAERTVSGQLVEDLDKMTISHKALMKEVISMKEELKKRDDKVSC